MNSSRTITYVRSEKKKKIKKKIIMLYLGKTISRCLSEFANIRMSILLSYKIYSAKQKQMPNFFLALTLKKIQMILRYLTMVLCDGCYSILFLFTFVRDYSSVWIQ